MDSGAGGKVTSRLSQGRGMVVFLLQTGAPFSSGDSLEVSVMYLVHSCYRRTSKVNI